MGKLRGSREIFKENIWKVWNAGKNVQPGRCRVMVCEHRTHHHVFSIELYIAAQSNCCLCFIIKTSFKSLSLLLNWDSSTEPSCLVYGLFQVTFEDFLLLYRIFSLYATWHGGEFFDDENRRLGSCS